MKQPLALFLWMTIALAGLASCLPPSAAMPSAPAERTSNADPGLAAPALHLTIAAGDGPRRLAQALLYDRAGAAGSAPEGGSGRPADLYIGYDPPAGFHTWPFTATQFVPVVPFWLPVTEVTYVDLQRIFRGEVANWADLGSARREAIVPMALASEPPPPLQPAAGTMLPDADALVAAFASAPGGIALVLREQVDVRMRALRVDGCDPLLEEGMCPGDPLVRSLFLALSPEAPDTLVAQVAAFAQKQQGTAPAPVVEIVVAGDILPGRLVERRIVSLGGDYSRPFAQVGTVLRRADLAIANLEGVLSDSIVPPTDPQTMSFVGSGYFAQALRDASVDAVSLANNHSRDFAAAGLSDTLALLGGAGIVPFGAGMDLATARRPALFEIKGVTFAFLGYDAASAGYYGASETRAGTAPADPAQIAADVAAAHQQADVVILYFHWGREYTHQASLQQQELAHQAITAGADIVLGSHPHWVQGLELYRGVPILYSLGNFVFDQMSPPESRQGLIARLVFRGSHLVNLHLQALQVQDFCQPTLLSAVAAEEVYGLIQEASPQWPIQKGVTP